MFYIQCEEITIKDFSQYASVEFLLFSVILEEKKNLPLIKTQSHEKNKLPNKKIEKDTQNLMLREVSISNFLNNENIPSIFMGIISKIELNNTRYNIFIKNDFNWKDYIKEINNYSPYPEKIKMNGFVKLHLILTEKEKENLIRTSFLSINPIFWKKILEPSLSKNINIYTPDGRKLNPNRFKDFYLFLAMKYLYNKFY